MRTSSILFVLFTIAINFISLNGVNVTATLRKIHSCIENHSRFSLIYPTDAEEHHKLLLAKTRKFRGIPPQQVWNPLNESFIEKMFIERFIKENISYFGGMFPLFIQWTDYQLSHRVLSTKSDEYSMFHEILGLLRPNVVYLVVSQANKGIPMFNNMKNVLVLSAGGVGHVPIPLVKGRLNYSVPNLSSSDVRQLGFYGSVAHGPRQTLMKLLQKTIKKSENTHQLAVHHKAKLVIHSSDDWVSDVEKTIFNLAPVGFGRGSFRLSEVIRIGRIPVYLYADYPWLPYEGTEVSPASLGLTANAKGIKTLYDKINSLLSQPQKLLEYFSRVEQAHFLYTNEGIIQQIELFLLDPFAAGYLRCSSHLAAKSSLQYISAPLAKLFAVD